ncbi:MAG TPA: amidase family protein [Acidimicrobiales bacterium]|jgi:Asp-tRNA(Asn)/Glu-tRNA(Gln) amidotransferase A subunit family amidase|nr:amidase family protein [Acidimicrobiales bacterium]
MARTDSFFDLAAGEVARRVREGDWTAREATELALSVISERNGEVNAFVAIDEERSLEQAAAVDALIASGSDPGPLAGVPIGVKDLEDAVGFPTTFGSPLSADAAPAIRDSHLVERLRRAGCVVVGKTNTPEYGWTACTTNAVFGYTHNPWNLEHSAGGSSGGSAAAIAAGMVPLATGSDGGGSIRIPSALCGLSGFKPSFGRVPAGGPRPPGWLHFSSKGPMARSILDVALALDSVVGPEQDDLSSIPRPEASWLDAVTTPGLPIRVAWSPTLGYAPVDHEVLAACERALGVLEGLGVDVIEVPDVFESDPVVAWLDVVAACHARDFAELTDHPRFEELHPQLRAIAEHGSKVSGVDIVRAYDEFHRLNLRLVELFRDARILCTPTTAAPAPHERDGILGVINGVQDVAWVRFTYPFNMTRNPAATVCAGLTSAGLPVGLQLVGPQHADLLVLRSAAAFESALGFSARPAMLGAAPS